MRQQSSSSVGYLQDRFTAPSTRNKGVARVSTETVTRHGAQRYGRLIQEHNTVARFL
ncbi:hypothetical protein [Chitinivorax sp. B]|uniref:hypothetical protein n=1 Tax=Chitinivorax sp. B TaxID=2502235 RepID=UPI00148508E1|nr:hypothetical protein [Chitinivorax sp. B]